jgi:DNA polymerase II small subunit/DNA polymerase delta subunit B
MAEKSLLSEYIKLALTEGGYIRNWAKKNSILHKLGRIFGDEEMNYNFMPRTERNAQGLAKSWLQSLSKSRSLDITKEFKMEVIDFAASEWDKIMRLVEDDIESARVILKKRLNSRYAKKIEDLERLQNNTVNEI